MGMFRKIYAITTENDFYKFRARCSREGYSMGEALTSIVHNFCNSKDLILPKKVAKAPIVPDEEKDEILKEIDEELTKKTTEKLTKVAKEIIEKEKKPAKKES